MISWVIATFLRTVLAEIFVGTTAYLAWVSIERIRPLPVSIRWLLWATMMQFWITISFHLLLLTGFYNVAGALAWSALAFGAAYYFQAGRTTTPATVLRQPVLWWRWIRGSIRREKLSYLFLPAILIQSLICLIRPALGFDYMVYHGLRAALWVQQGLHYRYDDPSGWSLYRNFPAGGSVETSWAMLLFHSDRFVASAGLLYWPFYGLACYALARELGVQSRIAWLLAWFLSTVPTILFYKGEGQMDIPMHAFLLVGLVLAIRTLRLRTTAFLWLLGLATGLAASMKIPSYPCALILLASPLLLLFRVPFALLARGLLLGAFLCALLLVPWFYYAYLDTGYPLSPLAVHLGSWVLGVAPAAAAAYFHLTLPPGSFPGRDLAAFFIMFFAKSPVSLGPYLLVFLVLAPWGLLKLLFRDWRVGILLATVALYYVAFYLSPSFANTRLMYAPIDGRFFLAPLSFAVVLGYLAIPAFQPAGRIYMLVVTVYELSFFAVLDYQPIFVAYLPAFGFVPLFFGLMFVLAYGACRTEAVRRRGPIWTAALFLPLAGVALSSFGDLCRAGFYEPEKFWPDPFWPAVTVIDQPAHSYRIALTTTTYPSFDEVLALPFMGREFQNQIVYIPISRSGKIYDNTDPHRLDEADFEAWKNRLIAQQVDAVMTFSPRSQEMDWMESHPEIFQRIIGGTQPVLESNQGWRQCVIDPRCRTGWGLYRVIPVSRLPPLQIAAQP
jgi:hypothetical protein